MWSWREAAPTELSREFMADRYGIVMRLYVVTLDGEDQTGPMLPATIRRLFGLDITDDLD